MIKIKSIKILLPCLLLLISLTISGCAKKNDSAFTGDVLGVGEYDASPGSHYDASYDSGRASESPSIAFSESVESKSDTFLPEQNTNQIPTTPGQLTAGNWKDLDHWEFWLELMQSKDWDLYQKEWQFYTLDKMEILVTEGNNPITDAKVTLYTTQGESLWTSRTDNKGKAYLFPSIYKKTSENSFTLKVASGSNQKVIEEVNLLENKVLEISLDSGIRPDNILDLMFVVDTTGSMGDELSYLQEELKNVVSRTKESNPNLTIRVSSNYYRDYGDDYVVRSFPFTQNIDDVIKQISAQSASGGGDYEEAVEAALEDAIENHDWSENAKARLLFLVLDAPPHRTDKNIATLQRVIKEASNKGIHIIPVASSGVDKTTEFLLRFFSISTNGTYVFLTDHSGIGDSHIEPTIGQYDVELLNELLINIIQDYLK